MSIYGSRNQRWGVAAEVGGKGRRGEVLVYVGGVPAISPSPGRGLEGSGNSISVAESFRLAFATPVAC